MIPGILNFPMLPCYLALRQSRGIDGWLTNDEARFLFAAARLVQPPEVMVEIGCWHGKSSVLLARGARHGLKAQLISVDLFHTGGSQAKIYEKHSGQKNHRYREIWNHNLRRAGCAESAVAVEGCSWENSGKITAPIGLLFVDGDHSEDGVRRDWEAYRPKLAPRCTVLFHDYLNPDTGVKGVVDSIREGWNFGLVGISAVLWRDPAL